MAPSKDAHLQTSANSHKTFEIYESFLPRKFPAIRYSVHWWPYHGLVCQIYHAHLLLTQRQVNFVNVSLGWR